MALAHCTCNKLWKKSTTNIYASHNESLFSSPLLSIQAETPQLLLIHVPSIVLIWAPFCVHLLPCCCSSRAALSECRQDQSRAVLGPWDGNSPRQDTGTFTPDPAELRGGGQGPSCKCGLISLWFLLPHVLIASIPLHPRVQGTQNVSWEMWHEEEKVQLQLSCSSLPLCAQAPQ